MRKLIYLLITLLVLNNLAIATEIKGGVSFNVNSAREYLQNGEPDNVEILAPLHFTQGDANGKVVYSYNNNGDVTGITVQYKNEPTKAYIYGKDYNLKYINQYDKSTDIYPHRGYRYDLNGKLVLSSLIVSKNEQFRFDPNGNLIAHSVKNIIYDENGNIIGKSQPEKLN